MLPEDAAELVASRVGQLRSRPLVLAFDGPGGAGTSTLAASAAVRLGATVIAGDDFYRDMPEAERWALPAVKGVNLYFDWERLRRSAIEPLRARLDASFQPFGWRGEGGLAADFVTVAAAPIIIVEGIYTARPELSDLIDLAVLVETPPDARYRRLLARGHDNQSWWSRWTAAENYYFTQVRPYDSLDLVVPGC